MTQRMVAVAIHDQCCALFECADGGTKFCGSGFLFRHRSRTLAATANHCTKERMGQLFFLRGVDDRVNLTIVKRDEARDLCLMVPEPPPANVSLEISNDPKKIANVPLCVLEYSTTIVQGSKIDLNPATRMGNCVRVLRKHEVFGEAGVGMLELSFPALRGASGAAVIQCPSPGSKMRNMVAHGVIVANSEHHLLPAQIETTLDAKNSLLEERRYYLPQAVAVNSVHLVRLVEAWLQEESSGKVVT